MATDDKLGTGHDKVDYATLTAITTPPGLEALTTVSTDSSGSSKVLRLIDECCLLMEKYVSMNGNGRWSNLRFKKHMSGGSGRGPVDDYNLLCDILSNLRRRYYESKILEGDDPIVANDSDAAKALKHRYDNELPGAVYKFLAKDIMTFNHSWQDDAFGDPERVPGWYQYLKSRRGSGFIPKAAVEVGP
ncbi:hypothetical protein BKA69DRAFT_1091846 [Paraphysoderma sedebokerense]|nr:hypothetical protein BKA69DRAFT_1091846 [Paraphysoderma sedebokerense]